jgi:hypothetical protein
VTRRTDRDGGVPERIDDGDALAVEFERPPGDEGNVARVALLGDPQRALEAEHLAPLAVLDAVNGAVGQPDRLDVEQGSHDHLHCMRETH